MAKRKPNPIKPASFSNPNPDYIFPIPEANKILGNAYVFDGNATADRVESRSHNKRNVNEMRSDKEQLGYAADDIRVGKEYLSGKRHAFNVRNRLDGKIDKGYMPDLYQPFMNLDEEPPRINTYDWRHYRDDGPDWVGNFIPKQVEAFERSDIIKEILQEMKDDDGYIDPFLPLPTSPQKKPLPQHIQADQFKTSTKTKKPHNDDQLTLF